MKVEIQKSFRKSITVRVKDGIVIVKAPFFVSHGQIQDFLDKHDTWIQEKLSQDEIPELSDQ
ncbi:M48 family metallopeptidase, partial [Candidatus Gracilibacteria bacterium]|nr:M48 family metallopeptidase [Candidatus Gracilibacteria bacterium]